MLPPARRSGLQRFISIAVTAGAVAALAAVADLGRAAALLRRADPSLVLLAVISGLLAIRIGAARWRAIAAGRGIQIPSPLAFRWTHAAAAISQLGPTSLLGEFARARAVSQRLGARGALAASLLDRAWGVAGLALVCLALAPAAAWLAFGPGAAFRTSLCLAPLAAGAAALAGRRRAPSHLAWSAGLTAALVAQFWGCARALGAGPDPVALAVLFPFVLLALSIPVAASNWGIRELASVALLGPLGLSREELAAASILYGLTTLAAAAPGLLHAGSIASLRREIETAPRAGG